MNVAWIVLGGIMLIPPAWVALTLICCLVYYALASNWVEYLAWPGIIALAAGGGWLLAHGLGVA